MKCAGFLPGKIEWKAAVMLDSLLDRQQGLLYTTHGVHLADELWRLHAIPTLLATIDFLSPAM